MKSYKVHFKFNNSLTKSEKYEIKRGRMEPVMSLSNSQIIWHSFGGYLAIQDSRKNKTNGGPTRATLRRTIRYTALMCGLTRHMMKSADAFKSFRGSASTFTDPIVDFIRKQNDIGKNADKGDKHERRKL